MFIIILGLLFLKYNIHHVIALVLIPSMVVLVEVPKTMTSMRLRGLGYCLIKLFTGNG
jgi:hypothetical protein